MLEPDVKPFGSNYTGFFEHLNLFARDKSFSKFIFSNEYSVSSFTREDHQFPCETINHVLISET